MSWEEQFDRCAHWIEAALEHAGGTHTVEDVRAGVIEGRYQFFYAPGGCAVTEVIDTPRKRVLSYFLVGGDLDTVQQYEPLIEGWAREQGCSRIEFSGRRGWTRSFLQDRGYEERLVVMSKELDGDGQEQG